MTFFLRERCAIIKSFWKLHPGIQIIFGNICKKCRTKFVMIREFPNINKAEWRMENKTCSSGRICRKGRKNADNGTKRSSYEKSKKPAWFSLLLGICLLVSMQLSAFAESQSAEGIPEAVTTGSGQLQEQSGKAEEQSAGNGQIQAEERSAGNGQIQAEERSAGNGQIQAEEQTAENRQTMAEQQERAVSGKIEAKVYLRYSNEVPSAINNAFAMGEFGPSGNDKPYFTVTVDLDELNEKSKFL